MCKQHGGDAIEVCDKCQLPVCIRCNRKEKNCQDALTDHAFSSLNAMKEEITAHFTRLLQSASEKLTEICKTNKYIWKVLDEEEVECAKRIQMIERFCDEQIEVIREESEKLKDQIYEYQKELTDQVESYNTELMAKKERLEKSCTEVQKWLRESHVTEKVEQKQQMTDKLVNNTDVKIDCPLTRTPALIHTGKQLVPLPKLAATPTSLTLMSEHSTNSVCCSAAYMGNEKLLLACSVGVKYLNKGSSEVIELPPREVTQIITSVQINSNNIYILECSRDNKSVMEITVYQCLSNVSQKEKLFSFKSKEISLAAVSKDYLVATKRDEKKLVVYDLFTKSTRFLTPTFWPFDLHFLSDGDLLALSTNSDTLIRYRIEDDQLITIWTCEGLLDPRTVTSDGDGFIYASSRRKTIYIISPEGERMKEISNDNLPDLCGQISVRGRDELAVPTWTKNSVCLFKIHH
ncbi:uncharacterized protein [Watersipora subatra]|uniref:uncharacterized protein n=1 Tax=Watersipora subatra TaxID=2589382 RepID=UPI00355B68EA